MSEYDILIQIKGEKGNSLLETKAKIPEHVYKETMQQFGFHIDEPTPIRPIPFTTYTRVKCKFRETCTETNDKCKECANNESKSYFIAK